MLESSVFLGFVFPGELALLLGGVAASQGRLPLVAVLVAGITGAVAGDAIGYVVGKRWGRRVLDSTVGRLVRAEHLDRAETALARRGGAAVLVGRFTVALRVLVPGLAGMARMPYRRFAAYNVTGAVAWGVLVGLAGYAAGSGWRTVAQGLSTTGLGIGAALAVVAGLWVVGRASVRGSRPRWLRAARLWVVGRVGTGGPRHPWLRAARLWVVVLGFVGVAVARSIQVGVPFRDPGGAFLRSRVALTAVVFVGLVVLDGARRAGRPLAAGRVWGAVRDRWTPTRLALAWGALLAYHVTYFSYHNLKSWDVFNAPRDQMLLAWDRWLFLGHSPAVLLHGALGQGAAAWVLMVWYETFPTLVVVAFPAAVVLAGRLRDAYVGIAAFVWVWILGTVSYYAVPSLGPFSSAPREFAGLPPMMIQDTQERYLAGRAALLAEPSAPDAFAQVSAFASLHVGVTAVILGLAWWHRCRGATALLTVFLLGTLVATVYLGWHFAVDDVAGLGIAALAWWLAPRTVGVRSRPPARDPATS